MTANASAEDCGATPKARENSTGYSAKMIAVPA
jgi:hypothetical protein